MTEKSLQKQNSTDVKARSLWGDAFRRFKKNKMAVISLIFLLLLALVGVITLVIDVVTDNSIYDQLVTSQNLTQIRNAQQCPSPGSG